MFYEIDLVANEAWKSDIIIKLSLLEKLQRRVWVVGLWDCPISVTWNALVALRPPSVHSGGLLDSWSSLVEGNERCLGPRGNLLCFWHTQNNMKHMNGNIPCLFDFLGWSVCSSPSTKELHTRFQSRVIHRAPTNFYVTYFVGKFAIRHVDKETFKKCFWQIGTFNFSGKEVFYFV